MPTQDTGGGGPFGLTNGKYRREIQTEIIDNIDSVQMVRRHRDSIMISDNFHLDARPIEGGYKVDIQYLPPRRATVATITLAPSCTAVRDVRTGLTGSLSTSTVWHVT